MGDAQSTKPEHSDKVGRLLAQLNNAEMQELIGVVGSVKLRKIKDILTKDQRRRAELILVAREALLGEQPHAEGGIFLGPTIGKAPEAAPFDLVYVAAYLENGYGPEDVADLEDALQAADEVPDGEEVEVIKAREVDMTKPCPFDPTHLYSNHFPGGSWYGYDPETHQPVKGTGDYRA